MPQHVVFAHHLPAGPVSADVLVALTPAAWEDARRRGLAVTVIDDHVDRPALGPDIRDYVRWQLGWFDRLDLACGARGSVRAAALFLHSPLDSLVVAARELQATVDGLAPSRITYLGPSASTTRPWHGGHLQFRPLLGDAPLAAELLPLIAARGGVAVESIPVPRPPAAPAVADPFRLRARRFLGPSLRRWQVLVPPDRHGRAGGTLLTWESGYGIAGAAAVERAAGQRLFQLRRNQATTAILAARPWPRAVTPSIPVWPVDPPVACPTEAQSLLDEVDEQAGVPGAGAILRSRFEYFVGAVAPVVNAASGALASHLLRLGITRVVTTNPSSVEEYAVLVAADRSGGIERHLLQHGDQLSDYGFWFVTETQNVDELWASDVTVAGDLAEHSARTGAPLPRIRLASPRIEVLRALPPPPRELDAVVCYLPSVMLGDSDVVGAAHLEDTWYHRWQLRLLELMAARPKVTFLWKALPQADQSVDPIPAILRQRQIPNVQYTGERLLDSLQRSGRVITDFPSTPLYEAVHARRPVLAVAFRRFSRLRPAAVELFAPVLRLCDGEEEALAVVDEFLADPPERWLLPSSAVLPWSPGATGDAQER